jgi:hypothetical protein
MSNAEFAGAGGECLHQHGPEPASLALVDDGNRGFGPESIKADESSDAEDRCRVGRVNGRQCDVVALVDFREVAQLRLGQARHAREEPLLAGRRPEPLECGAERAAVRADERTHDDLCSISEGRCIGLEEW